MPFSFIKAGMPFSFITADTCDGTALGLLLAMELLPGDMGAWAATAALVT
jgi:hypothetical protein